MTARKIDGHWYVDLRIERKRVRRRSPLDTKRGAQQYEAVLRARVLAGESLDGSEQRKEEEDQIFSKFAERWVSQYPLIAGNKPSEIASKKSIVENHLVPAFGKLHLKEITTKRIDAFTASLLLAEKSPKTVCNVLGVLSRCLRSAVEWDELERVPAMNKPSVPPPDFDWLIRDESEALLAVARDHTDFATLQFALDTGCRAGEQLAMRWGQIDFRLGKVLIRRAVWQGNEGTPKGHKRREVPLTKRLERTLKKHRHLRGPYVFCNDDGSPLTINQLEFVLKRTLPRAGLRQITWHSLRHSYASQLVSAGVSLRVVQELLGHSDIRTTMRYAHLAPGACRDAVAVLDGQKSGQYLGSDNRPNTQPAEIKGKT